MATAAAKKIPTAAQTAPGDDKTATRQAALSAIALEAKHGDVRQAVADLANLLAGK